MKDRIKLKIDKIDENIPFPPEGTEQFLDQLMSMKIGDSFLVGSNRECVAIIGVANRRGIVMKRKMEGKKIRLWKFSYDPNKSILKRDKKD